MSGALSDSLFPDLRHAVRVGFRCRLGLVWCEGGPTCRRAETRSINQKPLFERAGKNTKHWRRKRRIK